LSKGAFVTCGRRYHGAGERVAKDILGCARIRLETLEIARLEEGEIDLVVLVGKAPEATG
jgi:hypothetical protein